MKNVKLLCQNGIFQRLQILKCLSITDYCSIIQIGVLRNGNEANSNDGAKAGTGDDAQTPASHQDSANA